MFGEIEAERLAMDTWITNVIQTFGPHAVLNISPDKISPVLRKLVQPTSELSCQGVHPSPSVLDELNPPEVIQIENWA